MTSESDVLQLSHLEQTIYFACQRQGLNVLDADIALRLVDISRKHAVNLLSSMARKGALHRIGRGRYVVIPPEVMYARKSYVVDPHLIIDEVMRADGEADAYYVAYQSAAALHGAAHQLPFALMVAIPYQHRPITLGQTQITFVQLKRAKLFGFHRIAYRDAYLNTSDRDKTVLDCLERFDLCGGVDEVARTVSVLVEDLTTDTLVDYLTRMDNQALTQRLGLILERLSTDQPVDEALIARLARLVGEHTYPLDPHGPEGGEVHPRWRIRENIDVLRDL
jgi:predicted transcriptional regulator of viral defense system